MNSTHLPDSPGPDRPGAPPSLSARFLEAISLAIEVHGEQRRSGTHIPYAAHLLVVTGLVLEDGGGEDEAIAAMLHDAVEDGGGRPMLERIARTCGPEVASVVQGCTDNLEGDPGEPWIERKRRYLAHLLSVDDERILRVSLADKVHNARSIVRDYRQSGAALWERFPEKTARDQLWYYGGLLEFFSRCRPGPLTEDLWRAVGELSWLVANDEARRSDAIRLWLDPDFHSAQAPEGWIQVRSSNEAIQLLSSFPVRALSLRDDEQARELLVWLLEQDDETAESRWPADEVTFHGQPQAASVSHLVAAIELHNQRRTRRGE